MATDGRSRSRKYSSEREGVSEEREVKMGGGSVEEKRVSFSSGSGKAEGGLRVVVKGTAAWSFLLPTLRRGRQRAEVKQKQPSQQKPG